MWWGSAAWWGGWSGAAAALLLLLALRRRRKRAPRHRTALAPNQLVPQVHIVVAGGGYSGPAGVRRARPPAVPPSTRAAVTLLTAPADDANHSNPPQIVIVQNISQITASGSQPSTSQTDAPELKGIPKIPLPEQWLHKRPFDYKYPAIPRPLAQIVSGDLGAELSQESKAKKYSATRSPSLEKDDKSPFISSAKSVESDVFGFDVDSVKKLASEMTNMSENIEMLPKEVSEKESAGNLRRFRSVSTRLNMCSVNEVHEGHQERLEMQNSPRVLECSSAKEKSAAPKFDFSPKLLDSMFSPRFYTPPETVSPMFFAEPSPRSVYYDTVRSPKFFADTPKEVEIPQSPRALGDHLNRSNSIEKPNSPRILGARPSPKVYSCNKENYFTFEHIIVSEEGATRLSPRPRRYGGRNSIEKERFTPPADKEVRKYRRHNSCDTNYKNIELNITKCDDNKQMDVEKVQAIDKDEVDCCAKMESLEIDKEATKLELVPTHSSSAQVRRQRLKSISLDSDNARIIEQNLGLPIAKQIKDQMNEAYKNQEVSTSCESMDRHPKSPHTERPIFKFEDEQKDKNLEEEEPKSPDVVQKKCLRQSSDTQSFLDMPRFSPKEFEITVTTEEGSTVSAETHTRRKDKNLRNLTIDLTKRDSDLEKELLEFEQLYTDAEEKKVKTPTLKVKATSLDSSETVNLSLPQQKTLDVPQNSVSVPNTPKRQLKRILPQKNIKHDFSTGKMGLNTIQTGAGHRLYMKGQDSGIFLKDNHASLMLYQPGSSRMGSRTMGSFDENMADFAENAPEINVCNSDNRSSCHLESHQTLGSNLLGYKQNLSVSSTNLKTLPEGVPSDNFETTAEDEKVVKKLYRRNSNQSILLSTHSLQSSNCSLNSGGASCHNLATVRTSISNFSLNSDGRQRLSLDRRDSNNSVMTSDHLTPTTRVICSSNTNINREVSKNGILQRRGSNNSLTLNIYSSNNLSRHSSNTSLNKDAKPTQKKGLLERRSSNTSLTLNINTSNPQLSVNRGLSVSNYNINGSSCNLSRYSSNHSIDNPVVDNQKGILDSNTSLTINVQPQEPRDIEIDETLLEPNLKDLPQKDKHRKSLSTENLIPKSYKDRTSLHSTEKGVGFGSHDNLWSNSYTSEQDYPQNLTYVCGDQENEMIYAFGHQEDTMRQGFIRNITTKPLSPQSTSEDFRLYLANMQHLQNASSIRCRQQLRDLNDVFQNGYSKVKCHSSAEGQHCCSGRVSDADLPKENPQMVLPDLSKPCSEYQKTLLRNLHQEFWDLPTNFQEKPIVSGSHNKNRYKAILPNEHSRFILKPDAGARDEGYINANFIKGHEYTKSSYIATQGPLPNTIYDFWQMVQQNNLEFHSQVPPDPGLSTTNPPGVQKIVMLTNFIENNKQKCEKYFPLELNEEVVFDSPEYTETTTFFEDTILLKNSFTIKNVGMIQKPGYTIRNLEVFYQVKLRSNNTDKSESDNSGKSGSKMTVYHYWFHNWADHKCPKDANALLNLSLDVLKDSIYSFDETGVGTAELCKCTSSPKQETFPFPPLDSKAGSCEVSEIVNIPTPADIMVENKSPATIFHCSAGIGRTGCLIAILNGIKQLTMEQKVDVLGIVCNMRLNRGGMVQNSEQYELIHKVLCLYEQACLPNL